MSDPDQPAEDLDEDRLADEYPPEEPLAAEDQGVTGLEQLGGESVEEREERTEPEVWQRSGRRRRRDPDRTRKMGVEEGAQPSDRTLEGDLPVAEELEDTHTGHLAPDDDFTGDETTRDVAQERDTDPAEETAVHTEEEPPKRPPE